MTRKKALYKLYRGDLFIDVGTLSELSRRQNISEHTLLFEATPTYAARTKYENSLRVYRLDSLEP
ncbi:hypothetical protein NVV76_09820 [Pediococcus ethanolidurans]|uniref:hypothetical protein n=1 Tax=Pediococcus ethanolidurans TaxID=319653 RepID=UPI0021A981E3|nr:hypothetical protein [Pediococcus ethanolidurans]MCT4397873.1 hypothetical protein [Pediococcus ethanolidurans]MCV3324088.1 hypothetical protein [Pediococcus ethanolidurans]MCV3328446.1 hypothetical protein [Pediococcus ethanolidurans]MCV3555777.1 hypothetical protein [Pediococcus ethanolidurans]